MRTLPGAGFTGRARRARTEPMTVRPLRDDRYVVETESGTYVVDLDGRSCTCPDAAIRGARCKHIRRVAIEVNERRVPPPGKRAGVCAVCGRTTFVPMFESGPHLCPTHLFAPGAVVRDRETGKLLGVTRVTRQRADRYRTETGDTVASYESNEAYGAHEPVVEAIYLASLGPNGDAAGAKRYGFPASRLQRTERTYQSQLPTADGGFGVAG